MPVLIEKPSDLYIFKDSGASTRVARFIERYPSLATVLLEARDPLQPIFPEGRYALDARRDPAAPRDGIDRLITFQDAWGLDADRRAEGRITVVLESLCVLTGLSSTNWHKS